MYTKTFRVCFVGVVVERKTIFSWVHSSSSSSSWEMGNPAVLAPVYPPRAPKIFRPKFFCLFHSIAKFPSPA